MLSSKAQWHANVEALSAQVTPVLIELWGHGRSPSPSEDSCYTPGGYTKALDQVRRALGAERLYLCGQSFGATVTLRYAVEHAERVIAQVFTNSISALADSEWRERARADSQTRADALHAGGLEAVKKLPIHPRFAARLDKRSFKLLNEDAELLDPAGLARTMINTVPESPVRDLLMSNQVPTLLVQGRHERAFQPLAEWSQAHVPLLETVVLEAGHAVNLQCADDFNRAVLEFFGRHPE